MPLRYWLPLSQNCRSFTVGIDVVPEVIEQLRVAQLRRIVVHAHGLGMAGAARADLLVGRVGRHGRRCSRTPPRSRRAASRSRTSMHQKQPPAKIAVAAPAGIGFDASAPETQPASVNATAHSAAEIRRCGLMCAAPAAARRAARRRARRRCCSSACRSAAGRRRRRGPDGRRSARSGTRCAGRSA